MILGYKLVRQRLYIYILYISFLGRFAKIKLKLSSKHEGKYLSSQQQYVLQQNLDHDRNSNFPGD